MITSHLEQLIFEGKAEYRTFVLGLSGSNVIPVTRGSYIIITELCYMPFSNIPEQPDFSNAFELFKRANKQIEVRSDKSINHFVIRDSAPYSYIPVFFHTYLKHESDITINIAQIASLTEGALTGSYGVAPITDDIKQTPLGYGGLNTLLSANLQAPAEQYQPAATKNTGIAPASDYREQFKTDITAQTALIDFNNPIYNDMLKDRCYPIINVGYVVVNINPNERSHSS